MEFITIGEVNFPLLIMEGPGAVGSSSPAAMAETGSSSLDSSCHEQSQLEAGIHELPHFEIPSLVRLNVGGTIFVTTVDTLTQRDTDSMLAVMFSGRHRLHMDAKEGAVFIDRDGTHFRHILNWLRDGTVPILDMPAYQELLREAEYYQLMGLVENITPLLCKKDEDDNTKPEMTRRDVIKCLQFGKVRLRGVNLSGQNLSKLDLSNVDLSHTRLINTFFSRAKLTNADFSHTEADGANFYYANLLSCQFTGMSQL